MIKDVEKNIWFLTSKSQILESIHWQMNVEGIGLNTKYYDDVGWQAWTSDRRHIFLARSKAFLAPHLRYNNSIRRWSARPSQRQFPHNNGKWKINQILAVKVTHNTPSLLTEKNKMGSKTNLLFLSSLDVRISPALFSNTDCSYKSLT